MTTIANEALQPSQADRKRSAAREAMEFLQSLLAAGAVPVKLIQRDAEEAGHAWATVRIAQKRLGIQARKLGMQEGWVWTLPPKMLGDPEDPRQKNGGVLDGGAPPSEPDEPTKMLNPLEDACQKEVSTFGKNQRLRVWRQLLFPVTTTKIAAHYTDAGSAAARVFDFAPAALAR